MQTRLHDNIGSAEKEATDEDSRALSFGFEQGTQLDQSSIDQSREIEGQHTLIALGDDLARRYVIAIVIVSARYLGSMAFPEVREFSVPKYTGLPDVVRSNGSPRSVVFARCFHAQTPRPTERLSRVENCRTFPAMRTK